MMGQSHAKTELRKSLGALWKLGIMETGMDIGSEPEAGKGAWVWRLVLVLHFGSAV